MSGIKLLVDTNAVIKHLEGEKQIEAILNGSLVFISSITYAELLAGPLTPVAKQVLEEYLADTHIIHTNNFICETASMLRQTVRLKLPDALIAATSLFVSRHSVAHFQQRF